jgi:hypothetical protein
MLLMLSLLMLCDLGVVVAVVQVSVDQHDFGGVTATLLL